MEADSGVDIFALFERVLNLPSGERTQFLDGCGLAPDVRRRVEAMLAADAEAHAFDQQQAGLEIAATLAAQVDGAQDLAALPKLEGSYRIIRLIGEGGAGAVYEAEQLNPRRRVAIKALRPGLSSPRAVRRLQAEAEILGMLRHPGIAQVYEAGVGEDEAPGQAFIVMELVQGLAITRYAEQAGATPRDRVRLVVEVCRAVEHAHQRGVIHRDLKPANILVDEQGHPHVLDFGVARVLHDDAEQGHDRTEEGVVIGTLAYMSPEQASGLASAADVRADVYALGAILYELLAQRPPLDTRNRAMAEALRLIQSQTPGSLGSVDPSLRGDLSIIAARALEKDPERRFASVSALADELERYLEDRPIQSRPQSLTYVLARQVRRHRIVAALSVLLVVLVMVFTVWSSISAARFRVLAHQESQARSIEELARKAAERERSERERINARLESELAAARLERGRLEARSGNGAGAEAILFPAFFDNPESLTAQGALRELLETNPRRWTAKVPLDARTIAADADGRYFAVGDGRGGVQLLDRDTGAGVGSIAAPEPASAVRALHVDADGRLWVAHQNGLLRALERDDDAWVVATSFAARPNMTGVAFCDGSGLIATLHRDGWMCVWSSGRAALVREWQASLATVTTAALSGDGQWLAAGQGDGSIGIWSVESGELSTTLSGHGRGVSSLDFSPDGAQLASTGFDHLVKVWDLQSGRSTELLRSAGQLQRIAYTGKRDLLIVDNSELWTIDAERFDRTRLGYSIDGIGDAAQIGDIIAALDADGRVRAWLTGGTVSSREIEGHASWVFGVAIDSAGTRLISASGDETIRFLDPATEQEVSRFQLPPRVRSRCVILGPGERTVLAGCSDGVVRVFDTQTCELLSTINGPGGEIYALAYDEPSARLAACATSKKIRIWNSDTFAPMGEIEGFEAWPRGLAFAPDGRTLYSSGSRQGVLVCDLATMTIARRIDTPSEPWSIALSPDGSKLACGLFDASVCLIDLKTGELTPGSARHRLVVAGLDFSPDGTLIASGGDDGTVRLWATDGLREVTRLDTTLGPIPAVRFSHDGSMLAAGTSVGVVKTWRLDELDRAVALNVGPAIEAYGASLSEENRQRVQAWIDRMLKPRSSRSTGR